MQINDISVLVIDDEDSILNLLVSFLSENGYNVTGFTDSKAALESIKRDMYDVILTDLKMPDVTGLDIVKGVKETGHDTKVIIFTAYASIDSAINAVQQGVFDYLRKPFKLEEIKVILDRSIEQLRLQRENIALHARIQKMLNDITLLNDISSILYQVPDFEMASEMVIDTLSEGMGIKNAGIFLQDKTTSLFQIVKYHELSEIFIDQFRFYIGAKINSMIVSSTETTIISDVSTGVSIDNTPIQIDEKLKQCVLIPIQFLGETLGFLGIFNLDTITGEDELKLLKVLATEIAPIFQKSDWKRDKVGTVLDVLPTNRIATEITAAQRMHSSVSFALLRLTGTENIASFLDLEMSYKKIVQNEFGSKVKFIDQNLDSMLISLQGMNPVNIELSCVNVRKKIEELYPVKNGNPVLSIKYALATFPHDLSTETDIVNGLETKLLNDIIMNK